MRKMSGLWNTVARKPLATGGGVLLCLHVVLLFMTAVYIPVPLFVIQHLAAIAYLLVLFTVSRFMKLDQTFTVLLTVMGVWVQVFITLFVIGPDAGFQYYFFGTLSTAFFLTFSTKTGRSSVASLCIEIISLLLFLMTTLHGDRVEAVMQLSEKELFISNMVNSSIVLMIITFFADCYRFQLQSSVNVLKQAAQRDELTGLLNRRGIRPHFDQVQNLWTGSAVPFFIAILDIDDFKLINDTWGHSNGDRVLVKIAEVLSSYADDHTWCCRWGGEEFLIISQQRRTKAADMQMLSSILEKIRSISIPVSPRSTVQCTVTIGCAFPEQDMMIHELINKADNALYRGKSSGKNQVVLAE